MNKIFPGGRQLDLRHDVRVESPVLLEHVVVDLVAFEDDEGREPIQVVKRDQEIDELLDQMKNVANLILESINLEVTGSDGTIATATFGEG